MIVKVLEFSQANASTDSSYVGVVQRLADSVTRVRALQVQERDGRTRERAAVGRRRVQRKTIAGMLRHLVVTARVAESATPALAGEFPVIRHRGPNRVFLTVAQQMLAAAQAEKDPLIAAGLGEKFLDGLSAAVAQFDVETATAHQFRTAHVGARSEMEALVDGCARDIDVLDGLNRDRFAGNAELLAAWASVRNIPGPFRRQAEEPVPPAPAPRFTMPGSAPPAVEGGAA